MIRVRWSRQAQADIRAIGAFIQHDNAAAARRVLQDILHRAEQLQRFPRSGRRGRVPHTRELVLSPLPYIVVYRISQRDDLIEIVNVIHGAQHWPPVR